MKVVNKKAFKVAKEFSSTPGPRHVFEGDFSGELFRNEYLKVKLVSAIQENNILVINLDGTAGYGTSFLEEAFGGLIRVDNITYKDIVSHLELVSSEEPYLIDDIMNYLEDAKNEKL